MSTYRGVNACLAQCLNSVLNVKAVVGAFSVIVQLHRLIDLRHYSLVRTVGLSKLSFTASKLPPAVDRADTISGPAARLRLVKWSNINTKLNLLIFVIDLDTS